MRKCSPKFSGKLTPLTPPMLEVATAVRAEHSLHTEELDINPSSHHSDDSSAGTKAENPSPVASERSASPNDYTPTDEVQTSGGDEGHLDLYGLTREVLKLKKQTAKQAAQILRLKTKVKILVKKVKPVVAEYSSFVKLKASLSKKKKLKKAHKKKSSSFKQGRKKVSDGSTGLNENDVNSGDSQMMDVDDTISAEVHEGTAEVNEGTAEVHEGTAQVNEGTAEVHESTTGANLSTEPSMKEVEDEAGPSTFQDESDEFIQDDTLIADILVNITRPRRGAGITIPGNIPEQERPESPTLILDPKDKGKGIMKEEPKKKKLTLQQLRAAETANDEEVARKVAAEWEEEEERKRLAGLERLQAELEDNEMIAAEVQRTERENFTEEQKAKFLVETIAAQRRFRAEQQAALRRSKPPTIEAKPLQCLLRTTFLRSSDFRSVQSPEGGLIINGDFFDYDEKQPKEVMMNVEKSDLNGKSLKWRLYDYTGACIYIEREWDYGYICCRNKVTGKRLQSPWSLPLSKGNNGLTSPLSGWLLITNTHRTIFTLKSWKVLSRLQGFVEVKAKQGKSTRIILGWNANNVDVNIIAQDDKDMHARL
ncbi:hypothetical protein Tco_1515754 [Tanacetum coccineum]